MTTILRIQSGGDLRGSATRLIGQAVIDGLKARHPSAEISSRDLVVNPLPHIGPDFVRTMFADNGASALSLSNQLIDELLASDILVLESPMYNFTISSALKAWFDHVVRVRKTFRITETGVEGLLKGKKGLLVLGSGGVYSGGPFKPLDFQEPYLRAMLGFIGMTDLESIRVEGLSMGPGAAAEGIAKARTRVSQVLLARTATPQPPA